VQEAKELGYYISTSEPKLRPGDYIQKKEIKINVKKSNLIVFNPKTKMKERNITFGSDSILDEKPHSITRLL
ncbi:10670_t:CDS:2, partial [Gigaspora margarita]